MCAIIMSGTVIDIIIRLFKRIFLASIHVGAWTGGTRTWCQTIRLRFTIRRRQSNTKYWWNDWSWIFGGFRSLCGIGSATLQTRSNNYGWNTIAEVSGSYRNPFLLFLIAQIFCSECLDLIKAQCTLLMLVKSRGIRVHDNLKSALQCTANLLRNSSASNGMTAEEQVTDKLKYVYLELFVIIYILCNFFLF